MNDIINLSVALLVLVAMMFMFNTLSVVSI